LPIIDDNKNRKSGFYVSHYRHPRESGDLYDVSAIFKNRLRAVFDFVGDILYYCQFSGYTEM